MPEGREKFRFIHRQASKCPLVVLAPRAEAVLTSERLRADRQPCGHVSTRPWRPRLFVDFVLFSLLDWYSF